MQDYAAQRTVIETDHAGSPAARLVKEFLQAVQAVAAQLARFSRPRAELLDQPALVAAVVDQLRFQVVELAR